MKTTKTGIFTKIISCFLCTAITLQVGLALTDERVNADESFFYDSDTNTATFSRSSTDDNGYFAIENSSLDVYSTSSIYTRTFQGNITDNCNIVITEGCRLYPYTDVRFHNVTLCGTEIDGIDTNKSWALLDVESDAKVTITGTISCPTSSNGTTSNYIYVMGGTLIMDTLDTSQIDGLNWLYLNSGTIEAKKVVLDDKVTDYGRDYNFNSIYVSESFEKNDRSMNYTVVYADIDATIKSPGGNLTLNCNGVEKTFTTAVEGTAGDLVLDDPGISLENVPEIVYVGEDDEEALSRYGEEYVLNKCISIESTDYDGTPYLEYSLAGANNYSTTKPDSPGSKYDVRAVAPASGRYKKAVSAPETFTYDYYPLEKIMEDNDSPEPITIYHGVDYYPSLGFYVNDNYIELWASKGLWFSYSYDGYTSYYASVHGFSYDEYDNIFDDNGLRQDILVSIQVDPSYPFDEEHLCAKTDYYSCHSLIHDSYQIYYDTETPSIYYIGNEADAESITIEDGDVIKEDELTIYMSDCTLSSVTVDGIEYNYEDDYGSFFHPGFGDPSYFKTSYESTTGKSQTISISATDALDKTTSVTFTLKSPELGEVTSAVSVQTPIYVGDSYEPVVTVDGTDEQYSYTLLYDGEEEIQPTTAGEHTVFALVNFAEYEKTIETEKYSYTISKKSLDESISFSVPDISIADILVGGTVKPKVSGIPNDYRGNITYKYKLSTDDDSKYSDVVPTAAGTYTAMAVFPETDIYNKLSCEVEFSITLVTGSATVSVDDIYVGETVNPIVTTDLDTVDDTVFEYKLSSEPDSAYSETVPTAAGTYTVRATVPATLIFTSAVCTDTFTISKNDVTAEVTVADIYVGGTPSPVVTTESDGKADATFEYKLSDAPEDDYSDTVPVAAGTYSVRATVPETDAYLSTTCENTFTINKNTATATVTVADIYVGGTVSPVVDSISDGKTSATFEYKLSDADDEDYSDTVPTAAGDYSIRATIPETDTYIEITCENTFTISKNTPSLSIKIPDTIYVGDTIDVEVITPSTGEQSIRYMDLEGERIPHFVSYPQSAGAYILYVDISETDYYEAVYDRIHFEVIKKTPTISVRVPDVLVGESLEPTIETDSDARSAVYEYKLKDDPDSSFTDTQPEYEGVYTVRATIPETDRYLSNTCTSDFTISLNEIPSSAAVSVEDITVGGTVNAVMTDIPEDYDGTITIEYKSDEDEDYSTTIPTAAGTYTVRATLSATVKYTSAVRTDTFTISKNDVTASVSVADIFVGETPNPVVTTVSDGKVTIEYKTADTEFTTTIPTAAGEYTVRATVAESDTYLETSCSSTFTINKNEVTKANVSVADIFVGETPNPVVTTDSDGKAVFEYKISTAPDTSYTSDVPTAAGTYTIRATIPETDTYLSTTCTANFDILKNEVTASLEVADIKVGGTVTPVITIDPEDYDGVVSYQYKVSTDEDSTYTFDVPTAAGTYMVKATLPATDKYLGTTCTANFDITKKEATEARVSVADIFVGETPNPVVTTDSDGKAVFEYKISTAPDTTYTSEVPTAAGTYMVRATIPETDTYLGTTCTANFDILKNEVKASLAVADIKVGGTVKPVITINPEDYDGVVSYQYKISTAEDSTYTSAVPTAAGTYMVKATLPATDKYLGTTCTTNFDIVKNEVTASVSVDDILVGGTVKPVVTTDPEDYDGVITFEYKGSTDAAFSKTVPTAAGTYTVRATLPETAKFFGTTCTNTFTISKNAVTATVSVADIFVGETPKPVVTTDPKGYDGVITFEYKESSEADTAYTSAVPTAAGRYTVRATLSSTANFLGTSCEDSFSIVRKEVTASVSVANIYVGQTPSPVVITESDGKDKATFEYKLSSDPDTAFTTTAPTKLGTYTCKATIPETDNYLAITCSCEFVINLNPVGVLELSVPDTYYGLTVSSSYNTDSDGEVSIVYKTAGAPDTTYAAVAPTKVGDYTAMITVSETETYESASTTTNFKISYLEAPATAFVPKGTEGNNGYFTSDVDLTAPAGYTISTTLGSGYSGSVAYTESLGSIFLKRDDGALTAAIGISDRPKIDKVAPVISSASGVMYVDSMSISVSDKNLMSLTVNGSPVAVSGGSASVTLKRPEKGSKTFTIVAEDEAGNITTIELTLMEEWLSDRKVPEGQAVSLVAGEIYYFNEGEWIVSIVNSDGTVTECSTVFSCNLPFYVNSSGDYIFTRVT